MKTLTPFLIQSRLFFTTLTVLLTFFCFHTTSAQSNQVDMGIVTNNTHESKISLEDLYSPFEIELMNETPYKLEMVKNFVRDYNSRVIASGVDIDVRALLRLYIYNRGHYIAILEDHAIRY